MGIFSHVERVLVVILYSALFTFFRSVWCEASVQEQLSLLSQCQLDTDCGLTRTCHESRCVGFAGNTYKRYECLKQERCQIDLPGWFSTPPSPTAPSFMVAIIPANTSLCGSVSIMEESAAYGQGNCVGHGSSCHIDLSDITVGKIGKYGLCGCSNTTISETTKPCETHTDFSIPLGELKLIGFASPSTYAQQAVHSSLTGVTTSETAPDSYKCIDGSICELNNILGEGFSSQAHFISLIDHEANSCNDSPPFKRVECIPSSGDQRCVAFFSFKENEQYPMKMRICGCSREATKSVWESKCINGQMVGELERVQNQTKRRLQLISSPSANLGNLTTTTTIAPQGECMQNTDCLNGMGQCNSNVCVGFNPDIGDAKLIRCVEGYNCEIEPGDITGKGIYSGFEVIAISPQEACGTAPNLDQNTSLFGNSNKWSCEGTQYECTFTVGVGQRRNRTNTIEGVKLCGCPSADVNADQIPCNDVRDFYVPLGRVSIQECITNAHCADRGFAYCVYDHCGGFLATAASVGIKVFQCAQNQTCSLDQVGAKALSEGLKVLPVATSFSCGADAALDPRRIEDDALPCLVDMDNNGSCDINLGVTKALGTTRLCGCSGQDLGGNGRPCDQPEDFDAEIGLLNVGECVMNIDCGAGKVCAAGKCLSDTLKPYVVKVTPSPKTITVPPLNSITLEWNENIQFGGSGKRVIIQSLQDAKLSWEIEVASDSEGVSKIFAPRPSRKSYSMEISGQKLIIVPDTKMKTFPDGDYRVGYEFGLVTDLQGNANDGAADIIFSVYSDAKCPYLYLTGFSTENGNSNGLFEYMDAVNSKGAWQGGSDRQLIIYWKQAVGDQPANWVLDTNLDDEFFLAFPDLELMKGMQEEKLHIPPTGLWHKWSGSDRVPQPEIIVYCTDKTDRSEPTLIDIQPQIGEVGVPVDSPIVLTFSEPVTYGHWATIVLRGRATDHSVSLVPDWEAGMRGKEIQINLPDNDTKEYENNQVTLTMPEPLKTGETYDIIVKLGALTDLAYNPWGPVDEGVLNFTTFGRDCGAFSSIVNSTELPGSEKTTYHGSKKKFRCKEGYTTAENLPEIEVVCNDGTWDAASETCHADCEEFPLQGIGYTIADRKGGNKHGAEVTVTCSSVAVQLGGAKTQETLKCRDGRWDLLSIVCGASCGAFPTLGPYYKVSDPDGLNDQLRGARRVLQCISPAQPHVKGMEQEIIVCGDMGWAEVTIGCHVDCPAYNHTAGSLVVYTGEGTDHGSTRELRCASGYAPTEPDRIGLIVCEEGQWIQQVPITCKAGCQQLNLGEGYDVSVVTGYGSSYGTTVRITCTSSAIHESGPASEEISCNDGGWQLKTIVCKATCDSPDVQLGNRYTIEGISSEPKYDGRYRHGVTTRISCAENTYAVSGRLPHDIVCDDGRWRSLHNRSTNSFQVPTADVDLVCKAGCLSPVEGHVANATPLSASSIMYTKLLRMTPVFKHESSAEIECAPNNSSALNTLTQRVQCQDGSWNPKPSINCRADCGADVIDRFISNPSLQYTKVDKEVTNVKHGNGLKVTCTSENFKVSGTLDDTALCSNGEFLLPRLVCQPPSCSDKMRNLDEKGIDCGGQNCPFSCPDQCSDGIMNGKESQVDCGGNCAPCQSCTYPPKLPDVYATSRNGVSYTDILKSNIEESAVSPNTMIHVQCASHSTPHEINKRFAILRCIGGEWAGREELMHCMVPSCSDGVKNGDEIGVDCGGTCQPCPTCFDGLHNGDEDYTDCGGKDCLGCPECSLAPLKRYLLNTDTFTFSIAKRPSSQSLLNPASQTQHGTHIRITCKNNRALDIQCVSGKWIPSKNPLVPIHAAKEPLLDPNLLFIELAKLDETCIADNDGDNNNNVHWSKPEIVKPVIPNITIYQPTAPCIISVADEFNMFLQSECGALVYGGSKSKLKGFCLGTCVSELYSLLTGKIEECQTKINSAKQMADLSLLSDVLNNILELYCVTRGSGENQTYCFTSINKTLDGIRDLNNLVRDKDLLRDSCDENSCFTSNLNYVIELNKLDSIAFVNGDIEVTTSGRRLSSTEFMKNSYELSNPLARRLDEQFSMPKKSEPGAFSFLSNFSNVKEIIKYMCIEVLGESCGFALIDVLNAIPHSGASPFSTRQSSERVTWETCSSKCYPEVIRQIGKGILQKSFKHPYDIVLGNMMLSYGRIFCQHSFVDSYCGESIFPDFAKYTLPGAHHHGLENYISPSKIDFPGCQCPIEFISDGDCDYDCYTPECGYDGKDCLAQTMFSDVFSRVSRDIPIETNCNLYRADFDCQDPATTCSSLIKGVLKQHGCCLASILEIQRDILDYDAEHPLVKSGQLELTNMGGSASFPEGSQTWKVHRPKYPSSSLAKVGTKTGRSVDYLEQKCNISMDRTCSFALRRSVTVLDVTIYNIDYAKWEQEKEAVDDVARILREETAKTLAIPVGDIRQLKTWPGSIKANVIIDAGWLGNTNHFQDEINQLSNLGGTPQTIYTENLERSLQNTSSLQPIKSDPTDLITISKIDTAARPMEAPVYSTRSSPSLPEYGTFGMDDLTESLPHASCDPSLDLSIPDELPLSAAYVVTKSGLTHMSTANVDCVTGYQAIAGISPQDLICSQGKWIPATDSEHIKCRKPCSTFESEDSAAMEVEYVVSGTGTSSGSKRAVSCSSGHTAIAGPESGSEDLLCRNGVWDKRTLYCGIALPNAEEQRIRTQKCIPDVESLGEAYKFVETARIPEEIQKGLDSIFNDINDPLTVYDITCTRGFESTEGLPYYNVACHDAVLFSVGYESPFFSKTAIQDADTPLAAQVKGMDLAEQFQVYIADEENRLYLSQSSNDLISSLNCMSVKVAMGDPGPKPISDAVLISLLFLGLLFVLILILVGVWICRRYGGPSIILAKYRKKKPIPVDTSNLDSNNFKPYESHASSRVTSYPHSNVDYNSATDGFQSRMESLHMQPSYNNPPPRY